MCKASMQQDFFKRKNFSFQVWRSLVAGDNWDWTLITLTANAKAKDLYTNLSQNRHTHTHTHIYMYIYSKKSALIELSLKFMSLEIDMIQYKKTDGAYSLALEHPILMYSSLTNLKYCGFIKKCCTNLLKLKDLFISNQIFDKYLTETLSPPQ